MTPLIPLPPRARGKLLAVDVEEGEPPSTPACAGQTLGLDGGVGGYASTPACAGQTFEIDMLHARHPLYPRVRGANARVPQGPRSCAPLPPRARGKQVPLDVGAGEVPSTPACAGQTRADDRAVPQVRLYPRVRGANTEAPSGPSRRRPLPPRARGKPMNVSMTPPESPSTPACAGQTSISGQAAQARYLYPRVRGANDVWQTYCDDVAPLPPRARGKHGFTYLQVIEEPSTPACAGQTLSLLLLIPIKSLYPRVRGANVRDQRVLRRVEPLPPRARGKR
mgnify:CR=1 FL=1